MPWVGSSRCRRRDDRPEGSRRRIWAESLSETDTQVAQIDRYARTGGTLVELERNLLGARTEAHQKVEIYSGVARLARTVWGSEVRIAGSSRRLP